MNKLTLKIVTPKGIVVNIDCESVQLTLQDNEAGEGGGSYGIHQGHIETLFSLAMGEIKALSDNQIIFAGENTSGFATVKNNIVTAVVESFDIK